MKYSSGTLKTIVKNFILKIIFCSQLIIFSLSLPYLFYAGITYNKESIQNKRLIIITNKGKRILAEEAKTENNTTAKYPFFVEI